VFAGLAGPASAATFSNDTPFLILDSPGGGGCAVAQPASLYPSPITVNGLTGVVGDVNVTIKNFTRTDSAEEVRMLLVGPAGQSTLLDDHVFVGDDDITNVTFTLDDEAPGLLQNPIVPGGSYKPTQQGAGCSTDGIGTACDTLEVPRADCSHPVTGTGGADSRVLTAGDDAFDGLGGNDTIVGLAGHDCLLGSGGSDNLTGDAGNDTLSGGTGNDNLLGGDGRDDVTGGTGSDNVVAGPGDDVVDVFDGARGDIVVCGSGVDTVYADPGDTVASDCENVTRAARA
jgi:Ca2+-binding RTX toxin-like protein